MSARLELCPRKPPRAARSERRAAPASRKFGFRSGREPRFGHLSIPVLLPAEERGISSSRSPKKFGRRHRLAGPFSAGWGAASKRRFPDSGYSPPGRLIAGSPVRMNFPRLPESRSCDKPASEPPGSERQRLRAAPVAEYWLDGTQSEPQTRQSLGFWFSRQFDEGGVGPSIFKIGRPL
jgi:hypothetical protein